jgi:hypothetical protein
VSGRGTLLGPDGACYCPVWLPVRPPDPGQTVTGGAAFVVAAIFADRLLILTAALGLLFFLGFAMRERAAGRPSLPATMLLNATAVVPVLTFQADMDFQPLSPDRVKFDFLEGWNGWKPSWASDSHAIGSRVV